MTEMGQLCCQLAMKIWKRIPSMCEISYYKLVKKYFPMTKLEFESFVILSIFCVCGWKVVNIMKWLWGELWNGFFVVGEVGVEITDAGGKSLIGA